MLDEYARCEAPRVVLPTRKIVDAIAAQAPVHLARQPLPAGPQMRSTEYYRAHNDLIEAQRRTLGVELGELVDGDKKDLVITKRLWTRLTQASNASTARASARRPRARATRDRG
jgi:hypothetical protein